MVLIIRTSRILNDQVVLIIRTSSWQNTPIFFGRASRALILKAKYPKKNRRASRAFTAFRQRFQAQLCCPKIAAPLTAIPRNSAADIGKSPIKLESDLSQF